VQLSSGAVSSDCQMEEKLPPPPVSRSPMESDELVYFRQSGSLALGAHSSPANTQRVMRRASKEVYIAAGRRKKDAAVDTSLRRISTYHYVACATVRDVFSLFKGGHFFLEIVLLDCHYDDPDQSFSVRLLTRCYHPNVLSDGPDAGNLDFLHKSTPARSPAELVLRFARLLGSPLRDGPQVPRVSDEYKSTRSSFNVTARLWTQWFAHGPIPFGRWSPATHSHFPVWMRRRVVVWLLVWKRNRSEFCDMPRDVAMLVFPYICTADAYDCERQRVLIATT
jgi:ubiquitin-protein ligase